LETSTQQALSECRDHLQRGDIGAARAVLGDLESGAARDPDVLQQIAEHYLICNQHADAARCYARAVEFRPNDPRYLYNLAASKIAMGELGEAEDLLNRVIRLDPKDYDAWQNRSTLRTQTAEDNHLEPLKFVLAHLEPGDPGRVPVCYALAKELEDLGRYDESFAHLQQGAVARRRGMQYDVAADEQAMALIEQTFDAALLTGRHPHFDTDRPVFVLGLPRSGTTLVDRILNAHSQVASLGESNTLALAVVRNTKGAEGKTELIRQSAGIDFAALGRDYCTGIAGFGHESARLVDKTPLNFLYIGLIHLAMPGARIIHLRRHPLDSCYAMYKTLFRVGFPFTYSLQDVGRYYMAYRRLMNHWRDCLPGRILDVDYERLVSDQEGETRRMLDYCDLEFEDACLDFHKQKGPAATASAAQVRQPIYSSSVSRWRSYERQLAPLAAKLREHGIALD
jgi:tetratricopeptide (TPR) repeat protein